MENCQSSWMYETVTEPFALSTHIELQFVGTLARVIDRTRSQMCKLYKLIHLIVL